MYAFNAMEGSSQQYVELYLDSLDSVQSEPGFSKTDWPTFYLNQPLYNVAAIKVIQAEIPFSYYVVNSNNRTFSLTELATTAVVTLPIGNYNSTTLSSALSAALTAVSPNGRTYSASYSTLTEKFTITASSGDFTLSFSSDQTSPCQILGFPVTGATSSASVLVASFTSQITGPNYVYVNSTQLGSLAATYLPQNSVNLQKGLKGPQIARIPIRCNPGDVSYYKDPVPDHWFNFENLRQMQSFDLYLTLGNQAPEQALRLNGQNFSIKLGVLLNKEVKTFYGTPTVMEGSSFNSWR